MGKIVLSSNKILRIISRTCTNISAVMLGTMITIIGVEVIFRYALKRPIKGVTDLVELIMIIFVFFTTAEVAIERDHINVRAIFSRLPLTTQNVFNMVTSLLGSITFSLITWRLGVRGINQLMNTTSVTPTIEIPIGPFLLIAAFGSLILTLVLLSQFIENIHEVTKSCRRS